MGAQLRVFAAVMALSLLALSGCGQSPEQAGKEMEPPSQQESMKDRGFSDEERGSVDARGH